MTSTATSYSLKNSQFELQPNAELVGMLFAQGSPTWGERPPKFFGSSEYLHYFVTTVLDQLPVEIVSPFATSEFRHESWRLGFQQDASIGDFTGSEHASPIGTMLRLHGENFYPWPASVVDPSSSEGGTNIDAYATRFTNVLAAFRWVLSESDVESFDEWMESTNSRVLDLLILDYSDVAMGAMGQVLASLEINIDAAVKALRQVGKITDSKSHKERLNFLIRQLRASDPRIRDSASVAIANLGDQEAAAYLRTAVDAEPTSWVKRNLELALRQLKS